MQIDISQVSEEKRNDPRFRALLAGMQQSFLDPKLVHAICVHEAAHVVFLTHAGAVNPSAIGPRISYDAAKDEFNEYNSSVKFESTNTQPVAGLPVSEWLHRQEEEEGADRTTTPLRYVYVSVASLGSKAAKSRVQGSSMLFCPLFRCSRF